MNTEDTLRRWIRDHRICWEIAPLIEMNDGARMQVGFELRLFARHRPECHPAPGCPECRDLYEKLRVLAITVFPTETRPTRYDIAPFDASFHLRPESEWLPEVQLTVLIVHRDGYLMPVDACEGRCAKEIQESLHRLGARPKAWTGGSGEPAAQRKAAS